MTATAKALYGILNIVALPAILVASERGLGLTIGVGVSLLAFMKFVKRYPFTVSYRQTMWCRSLRIAVTVATSVLCAHVAGTGALTMTIALGSLTLVGEAYFWHSVVTALRGDIRSGLLVGLDAITGILAGILPFSHSFAYFVDTLVWTLLPCGGILYVLALVFHSALTPSSPEHHMPPALS